MSTHIKIVNGSSANGQRIIGIDPGLVHTGWGVITKNGQQLAYVGCGVISPPKEAALAERLFYLSEQLHLVIEEFAPNKAAIEETFVSVNGASTLKLGQARGALLLTLSQHHLPIAEFSARMVKKSLTGTGKAEKDQVAMMVKTLLPTARSELDNMRHDALDALAIAICGAHH